MNDMKTMGIVFSNIYDKSVSELTSHRTVASLPFASRYRQIDFVLSNMSNSRIYNVGLITKHNYRSLLDHLGSCFEWDLNRKNEGLVFIPPFSTGNTGIYKGKLEALYSAIDYIDNDNYDYVVVADSTIICNIDFRKAIKKHKQSGADVTVIANRDEKDFGREHPLVLHMTEGDKEIRSISIDCQSGQNSFVGMGMFIFSRELLVKVIKESHQDGLVHLERDFLQRGFNLGKIKVEVYEFDGIVLRNEDIKSYYNNNMELLKPEIRRGIFKNNRPIYTKVRDEFPTYYAEGSKLDNCLVADGCQIYGKVSNSLLFRDVYVSENSEIEGSIIMQSTKIGKNVKLSYVILDKNVTINDGVVLSGTKDHPIIIKKGETV